MQNNQLSVVFDSEGYQFAAYNNMQVVIVRSFAQENEYCTACFVFAPQTGSNVVLFEPAWNLYTTRDSIGPLSHILPGGSASAAAGFTAKYTPEGFQGQSPAYPPDVYGFDNQSGSAINGGMAQQLSWNGTSVNAIACISALPQNVTTYFQPQNSVKVFLASDISANAVLPVSLLYPNGASGASHQVLEDGSYLSLTSYLEMDLSRNPTIYFDSTSNEFNLSS